MGSGLLFGFVVVGIRSFFLVFDLVMLWMLVEIIKVRSSMIG